MFNDLIRFIRRAKNKGIYPNIPLISGPSSDPIIKINGKEFLSFSSNNYLGLAQHKEIKQTAKRAIDKYGVGPASARLMSGNLDVYERLEQKTANFVEYDSAVVFSSGYMANTGTIASIVSPPYAGLFSFFQTPQSILVISDELNHASIIDGCRLSRCDKAIFKHNDCDSLQTILENNKSIDKLIIVDGVYSMDGDIAPLDKIVELAKKYNAAIMVDDAHGTGVMGKNGKGTFEYFGLKASDIDILMGTYVKAFGSVGGFICSKSDLVDYLKVSARSFIFSVCVPPSCAEATIKAIELVENNPQIRAKLWDNTEYLRASLKSQGFNTLNSATPIIPVLIGPEEKGMLIERELYKRGIFAPCVRWPAVEKGKSRIRLSVMATHKKKHLNAVTENLHQIYTHL